MIQKLLLILLCFLTILSQAQENKNWTISGKIGDGFVIAHRPSVVHLLQKHSRSIELNYTYKTTKKKGWEELYNFPEIGFGYQYFDLGNPQELGTAQSVFALIKFKIKTFKKSTFKTHLGLGLGYASKPFNVESNYKNQLYGSPINATINSGLSYTFIANNKFDITTGITISHFSNGSSKVPNMGINLATIDLGINYHIRDESITFKDTFPLKRLSSFEFLFAGGVKQLYPPNTPRFGVGIFTSDFIFPIKNKSLGTLGLDMYVDGSHKTFLLSDSIFTSGFKSYFRGGIHVGYGLQVGKCYGILQTGYYLYNPYNINGSIYSTLSFRYHINNHLFACFNLKSHYAKADYFQYGFGFKL